MIYPIKPKIQDYEKENLLILFKSTQFIPNWFNDAASLISGNFFLFVGKIVVWKNNLNTLKSSYYDARPLRNLLLLKPWHFLSSAIEF